MPALAVRTTRLVDTYMLWVGTTDPSTPDQVENAPSQGFLARDWACAMPPRDVRLNDDMVYGWLMLDWNYKANTPSAGTTLFRTSTSADAALGMAQRLGDDCFFVLGAVT